MKIDYWIKFQIKFQRGYYKRELTYNVFTTVNIFQAILKAIKGILPFVKEYHDKELLYLIISLVMPEKDIQ